MVSKHLFTHSAWMTLGARGWRQESSRLDLRRPATAKRELTATRLPGLGCSAESIP